MTARELLREIEDLSIEEIVVELIYMEADEADHLLREIPEILSQVMDCIE